MEDGEGEDPGEVPGVDVGGDEEDGEGDGPIGLAGGFGEEGGGEGGEGDDCHAGAFGGVEGVGQGENGAEEDVVVAPAADEAACVFGVFGDVGEPGEPAEGEDEGGEGGPAPVAAAGEIGPEEDGPIFCGGGEAQEGVGPGPFVAFGGVECGEGEGDHDGVVMAHAPELDQAEGAPGPGDPAPLFIGREPLPEEPAEEEIGEAGAPFHGVEIAVATEVYEEELEGLE